MQIQHNQSEVARLRARIEAESAAAHRALYDPMLGAAKHQFITARMENVRVYYEQLTEIVDPAIAAKILCDTINDAMSSSQ